MDDGHSAIRAYSSDFRALVGTKGGASPRDNTHSNKDSDGDGEQIWWLNGPRAADDYTDFYDGSWDHTNPVRTETGNSYTFLEEVSGASDPHRRAVWTGARTDGTRASNRHMGKRQRCGLCRRSLLQRQPVATRELGVDPQRPVSVCTVSPPVFLVEVPDAPYATTAAITTDPANGAEYQTGEVVKATVTFSEDVTVTGTPQLPLRIGGEERDADYVAGESSSTVLSFSYTVTDDDTDLDGISIDAFALKLNGGSIKRTDTNADAALTHTRVLADDEQLVNLPPLITGVESDLHPAGGRRHLRAGGGHRDYGHLQRGGESHRRRRVWDQRRRAEAGAAQERQRHHRAGVRPTRCRPPTKTTTASGSATTTPTTRPSTSRPASPSSASTRDAPPCWSTTR